MPIKRLEFGERDLAKIFKSEPKISWRSGLKGLLRSLLASGLAVAIILVGLNFPAYRLRWTYQLTGPPTPAGQIASVTQPQPTAEPAVPPSPPPVRSPELSIGKIGSTAPIIYDITFDQVVEQLRQGVVHLIGTAKPGEIGNVVIFGHSSDVPWVNSPYRTVFTLLDKLASGDLIQLVYQNNIYNYRVTDRRVVKPTEISVLDPTAEPTLTLISCYPVGTVTNRIVVRATLDQTPTGSHQEPVNLLSLPVAR